MKRRLLPKEDADYILESFGVKIKPADWRTGMAFFDKNGKRIEE